MVRDLVWEQEETELSEQTAVHSIKNKEGIGGPALADVIRAESKQAVQHMQQMDYDIPVMPPATVGIAMIIGDTDVTLETANVA